MAYSAMQLAEAFISAGELVDALDALSGHLDANPGDDAARRLRAGVRLRLEDAAEHRAALADLDALRSLDADDYVQRSIVLQRIGDLGAANAAMEQARALKPDDDRILERYLTTLELSGQREAARKLVNTLPKTWRWQQIAGDLAREAGDLQAAAVHYTTALDQLEQKMDTVHDAFGANLKAVLVLKRDAVTQGA